ncbi:MAG: hypothetical protein ABSG92_01755 [Conexivisphaerales archaeon]
MLDLNCVELCIKPSKPYGEWVKALKLMGYAAVGLDLAEAEASEFQAEAGHEILCFLRTASGASDGGLPWVDSCPMAEASKRRKPPSLLALGIADRIDDLEAFLAARPNRVEALELNMGEVRASYEKDARGTFEWTSRLARAAGARRMPILLSSHASTPEGLVTPLSKKAFAVTVKTGGRSGGARERRFLKRLEQTVRTRERVGAD